jgi:hypothetical protein
VPFWSYSRKFLLGYEAIRWIALLATFWAFEAYLRRFSAPGVARLVVLFLAGVYPLSYFGYRYQPTSVLDLACFTAALALIARGWHWRLVPLLVLAALNRNTAVFILGAYGLWHLPRLVRRTPGFLRVLLVGAALGAAWLAVVAALESLCPAAGWAAGPSHYIRYNLGSPRVWVHGAVMLAVPLLCVGYAWRAAPPAMKCLCGLLVPYVAIHFAMARCDEVRYWLNLVVLLGPFAAASYRLARGDDPASVFRPEHADGRPVRT